MAVPLGHLGRTPPLLGALLVTLAGQGMRRQLLAGTLSDRLRGLGQGLL